MWGGFTLIVGRYLDFLDVLGWVGGAEMWELRIRCSNWGGCVKDKVSGWGGGKKFKLVNFVWQPFAFYKFDYFGVGGRC